jgi:protein-S-isoprenylcysteine O-methyltransferase Ste14
MSINRKLLVGEFIFVFLVIALSLFLAAGTLAWPTGWAFLILFCGSLASLMLWLSRHNPALLKERMALSQPGQKAWDKVIFLLLYVFSISWLILMPLDAVRFHWSLVPLWLQIAGVLLLLCSFYIFYRTFRENSYLSPVVRIQEDRGQTVISTGPYQYVRHPMYSAFLFFIPGTALLLGSWYGLLWGLLLIILFGWRAVLEERTLRDELQGYAAYMTQVKYRLVPYVW